MAIGMVEATDTLPTEPERSVASLSPVWWLWSPLAGALALLVLAHFVPTVYATWFTGEVGVLEVLQLILLLASLAVIVRLLIMAQARRSRWLWLWLLLAGLCTFYIAGEEASWGQHYLGWGTPETWQAVNDQGETNLHNTSSWLDQKPRTLLELGVVVGGLLIPISALIWPAIRRHRLAIVFPTMVCLPSAFIAEFARMSERLLSTMDAGFLFHRASEVQELYFYLFILLYLIVMRKQLLALTERISEARLP